MMCSLLLATALASAANTSTVVVVGSGSTTEAAQRAACLSAVKQVAGSRVTTVTQVSDMADVWARIAEFSDGYVVSSRLLEEPVCGDDICRVKLEVVVAMAPLETDLARLSELIGDPLVAVRAADRSEISAQAAKILKTEITTVGLQPAADLGGFSSSDEDITLLTGAEVDCFVDMGVSICDLDLQVELVEATTETALTYLYSRGRGRSVISARDAERKAVREAANTLRGSLREDLIAAWQDFLKNGQVFRVVYRNDDGVADSLQDVRDALQLVPGLRGVNERSITGSSAVLDVRFEGLAGELRSFLVNPLAEQDLGVVGMRGRRLEIGPLNRY